MRALSVTQQPRLKSQLLPSAPSINRNGGLPLNGLISLYAPKSASFGRASSGGSTLTDLENLAPFTYGSLPNRRFWRRASTNAASGHPETKTDAFGPYWDCPTNVRGRLTSDAAQMPWRPADNGGHAPGTLMAVAMLTSTPAGNQALFCFSGNNSNVFWIGVSAGGVARGQIRTNTLVGVNTAALQLYRPYCLIFTTRSNTDHEIVARDLVTGSVLGATSASNSGLVGTISSHHQLFHSTGAADLDFFITGRLYTVAFWARSMSQDEMYRISSSPFDLLTTQVRARRFGLPSEGTQGDLAVALGAASLTAKATVRVVGDAAVTLSAATLSAQAENPIVVDMAETLAAASLSSVVSVNNGVAGIVGETPLLLGDATLASTVENDVLGDLSVSLAPATLAAVATVGSTGPFAIRPSLVFT